MGRPSQLGVEDLGLQPSQLGVCGFGIAAEPVRSRAIQGEAEPEPSQFGNCCRATLGAGAKPRPRELEPTLNGGRQTQRKQGGSNTKAGK